MVTISIHEFESGAASHVSPDAWTIRVEEAGIQAHTFACQTKDGCFVSAHTKLAGFSKRVVLSKETLARDFCTAINAVMRKRHGDSVELILEPSGRRKNGTTDDAIVLARIQERNFVPNKSPRV